MCLPEKSLSVVNSDQSLVRLSYSSASDRNPGLLYVPQLPTSSPCSSETEALIPANVTRLTDLDTACALYALAPWTSANCARAFLEVARSDKAIAAIFYLPDKSSKRPPPADDAIWALSDDEKWKRNNYFRLYAISGDIGQEMMNQSQLYSGHLSSAPNGNTNTGVAGSMAQKRLVASFDFSNAPIGGPRTLMQNLWIFLLAVLGILIFIIVVSSLVMRLVQRRRRHALQRRIQTGEIDVEMLGIKRLNVPKHLLDAMPLYTYANDGNIMAPAPAVTTSTQDNDLESPSNLPESQKSTPRTVISQWLSGKAKGSSTAAQSGKALGDAHVHVSPTNEDAGQLIFSQVLCPICLEDYKSGETTVRELPCRHLYHPECIDTFLLLNSSLCPVCKTSVLPIGYFPNKVTNLMVRQERLAVRIREERARQQSRLQGNLTNRAPNIQLNNLPARPGAQSTNEERQEVMRRRALAMLGNDPMVEEEERERDAARPKWLKVLHRLVPILR